MLPTKLADLIIDEIDKMTIEVFALFEFRRLCLFGQFRLFIVFYQQSWLF